MWLKSDLQLLLLVFVLLIVNNNAEQRRKDLHLQPLFHEVLQRVSKVNDVLLDLISSSTSTKELIVTDITSESDYSYSKEKEETASTTKSYNKYKITEGFFSEIERNEDYEIKFESKSLKSDSTNRKPYEIETKIQKNNKIDQTSLGECTNETNLSDSNNDFIREENENKIKHKAEEKSSKDDVARNPSNDRIYTDKKIRVLKERITNLTNRAKYVSSKLKEVLKDSLDLKKKIFEEDIMNNNEKLQTSNILRRHIANDNKTMFIFVTRNESSPKEDNFRASNRRHADPDPDSGSNDINDLGKLKKTVQVLRSGYGSVCLSFVKKKCIKAMKLTYKIAHRKHNFRHAFKEEFKARSNNGCTTEFSWLDSSNKKRKKKKSRRFNVIHIKLGENDKITPETREGGKSKPEGSRNSVSNCVLTMVDRLTAPKKIESYPSDALRKRTDKYERACARDTAKKCANICQTSFQAACNKTDIKWENKEPFLTKTCTKQCKKQFGVRDEGSSSSSNDKDD